MAEADNISKLNALLTLCVQLGASDLHLTPGLPPHARVEGDMVPLKDHAVLTPADTVKLSDAVVELGKCSRQGMTDKGAIDGALTAPGGVRFRFNIFRRQNEIALVLRQLEERFRSLAELGLPESLHTLSDLRDGLVIIAGPTGAGKSTTLATLLDRINRSRPCHIITIEDPIEYIHRPLKSVVNQRQIGLDAPSFNDALVSSLRQDPDVILVGEIRDLDTIRTAITASETGHLVFTTLHAGDCVSSIERLVSVFPADEQDGIRRQLSLVLRAIVAQHLLPICNTSKPGRTCTSEVLMVNPAIANLIASAKSTQIYSSMEAGGSLGMQTLEQDLARLWVSGRISETTAVGTARNVNVLRDRAALMRSKRATAMVGSGGMR